MQEDRQQDEPEIITAGVSVGRVLNRPTLYLFPLILNIFIPIFACSLLGAGLYYLLSSVAGVGKNALVIVFIVCPVTLFLYICFRLKSIVIWLVHLYQCVAPSKMRLSCCMTPCCSDYMILALKKYGLFRGLKKGFQRLKRCRPENEKAGEEDYP